MWPDRVGGIAASCAEAFRPYSPVLSTLTGVCYWWGWVPTCGLTAILSASAITQWYLPDVPVPPLAIGLVVIFTLVNLAGVRLGHPSRGPDRRRLGRAGAGLWAGAGAGRHRRLAASPRASIWSLRSPGCSAISPAPWPGLYLIGFAAPAFEAAACHVGETVDPERNVPRAMLASGAMAAVYFVLLPVIWLGVLGPETLQQDLAQVLGPTFAPLLRQRRAGGRHRVHDAEHVPWDAAAAGRRVAHPHAAGRGRAAAAPARVAIPCRRALGGDAADRFAGHRISAGG